MEKHFVYVEDIIADEHFQSWYFNAGNENLQQWERWLQAHPEQMELVNEAKLYMDNLSIVEKEMAPHIAELAEQRLLASVRAEKEKEQRVVNMRPRKLWWAAAAVLVLAISGITLWRTVNSPASMHTAFGQITQRNLPDGSTVMLNANSEISYSKNWSNNTPREVWLKGEAFFHVTKKPDHTRFVVHTTEFDVIVTGTQFNIVNRDNKANVLLTEGSVTIYTRHGDTIYMKPGDFIEFANQQPQIKAAQEEDVLAWRDKKLHFEDTPLRDVLQQIKDHYGVTIQLDNEALGNKLITGILPNDNLDILLQALEATTDFRVKRSDSTIVISY